MDKKMEKERKSSRIVKRSVVNWDEKGEDGLPRYVEVEKEVMYIEEREIVKEKEFVVSQGKKSWWTRILTGCMPSGDL
jgi:hypothetical protein